MTPLERRDIPVTGELLEELAVLGLPSFEDIREEEQQRLWRVAKDVGQFAKAPPARAFLRHWFAHYLRLTEEYEATRRKSGSSSGPTAPSPASLSRDWEQFQRASLDEQLAVACALLVALHDTINPNRIIISNGPDHPRDKALRAELATAALAPTCGKTAGSAPRAFEPRDLAPETAEAMLELVKTRFAESSFGGGVAGCAVRRLMDANRRLVQDPTGHICLYIDVEAEAWAWNRTWGDELQGRGPLDMGDAAPIRPLAQQRLIEALNALNELADETPGTPAGRSLRSIVQVSLLEAQCFEVFGLDEASPLPDSFVAATGREYIAAARYKPFPDALLADVMAAAELVDADRETPSTGMAPRPAHAVPDRAFLPLQDLLAKLGVPERRREAARKALERARKTREWRDLSIDHHDHWPHRRGRLYHEPTATRCLREKGFLPGCSEVSHCPSDRTNGGQNRP